MSLSVCDRASVSGAPHPYKVKVEIYADGEWCDINKSHPSCAADGWYRRLIRNPRIKLKTEVQPGAFGTSVSNLVCHDKDGLLSGETWTLYDSTGTERVLTTWYNAKIKISISHHVESQSSWTHVEQAVARIKDVKRSNANKTALIELKGMEDVFISADASDIKRGDAPPLNIPLSELVKLLVNTSSGEEIAFESGSPPADITIDTDEEPFVSLLGNVPVLEGDTWNEDQDFITRTQLGIGNTLYFFGYSREQNKPAVVLWDREENEWSTVNVFGVAGWDVGWEVVCAFQGEGDQDDKIFAFTVRNETHDSNSPYNHKLCVYSIDKTTLAASLEVTESDVWSCNSLGLKPYKPEPMVTTWGRANWGLGYTSGTYNLPVFFPSLVAGPSASEDCGSRINMYCETNDAGAEPYRVADVMINQNPGALDDTEWLESLTAGYYLAKRIYCSTYEAARTYTHASWHEAFKYDPERKRIYWVWWNGVSRWQLQSFNLTDATVGTPQTLTFDTTSDNFFKRQITAFDVSATGSNAGNVFAATVDLSDPRPGETEPQGSLFKFSPFLGSGSIGGCQAVNFTSGDLAFANTQDERYAPVLISIRSRPGSSYVWGQVVNWFSANSLCYGLWYWHSPWTTGNHVYRGRTEANLPMSSAPFEISQRIGGAFDCYVMDQATGTLWHGHPNKSSKFLPKSASEPVDGQSTWASSNLYVDDFGTFSGRLYCVTASAPPADVRVKLYANYGSGTLDPELGLNAPGGRLSLWEYSANLPAVIRVADLEGAKAWKALGWCREYAGDYVIGFNGAGNFFFKPRATGTPTLTIKKRGEQFVNTDGTEVGAEEIESSLDHKAVVNSITIPTWAGELKGAEAVYVLTPESKADSLDITVSQMNNKAQRVVLRCINSASLEASGEENPLLFSWRRTYADLTTSLKVAAASTATEIYIHGLRTDANSNYILGDAEIKTDDTLQVGDGAWTTITAVDVANDKVTIDDAIGGTATHRIGSTIIIRPRAASSYSDSTDGVCTVGANFSLTSADAAILTVDTTELLRPGMVLYYDTALVHVLDVIDSTTVYVKPRVLGSGSGQNTNRRFETGNILRGAIWFSEKNRAYPISNLGISVTLHAPTVEVYREARFEVNDRIVITCYGLKLKKIEHAIYRATNDLSIERYDKQDMKGGKDNRLIDPARARILLKEKLDLAWPAWRTKVKGLPLLTTATHIGPGSLFWVESKHIWPYEDNNRVAHHVIGWDIDLENGTMSLDLRSVSSTESASQPEDGGVPAWARHDYFARKAEE